MVPMLGLAYWPLLLWLPLIAVQYAAVVHLGSGMQSAVHSITAILVDTPVCSLMKIIWCVMLVLCLDCVRNVFKPGTAAGSDMQTAQMFEAYAAKEGALVLALNLAAMMAIQALHVITGRYAKLELNLDAMKRQAQQASEFSKQLMADSKDGKAPETKMESKKEEEKEGELRKRVD
ncbi:unnamed protein product [Cladocopium goreaui]|uniref:Protein kinase domain-containing protein n=1 Tax=Cladocopium goreaui TaxID=2562237 RepID=A0A9P1BHK9_9DINO|nr:unnamed protein product [Cladocopium goreaui]|mmetsp:Transcript_62985/g.138004  ORF Transcript_62985/g.138004 Transcript_62985/m.138004 type:complete len:176 (+) Transcript_62985:37-564(+)